MTILRIIETTDKKFIGETIQTDFKTSVLPSGEEIDFDSFSEMPSDDGKYWKLWNSNYIIIGIEV